MAGDYHPDRGGPTLLAVEGWGTNTKTACRDDVQMHEIFQTTAVFGI
jgi:hypothetical protein